MFFVCLAASSTPPLLLEVNCVFWNVDVASYIPVPACWRSFLSILLRLSDRIDPQTECRNFGATI